MTMHNPPHPGEFIRETYIEPFDISIRSLAESLGVSPSTLARVVIVVDRYDWGWQPPRQLPGASELNR